MMIKQCRQETRQDHRSFRSQDWRWQQALLWQLLERKKTDAVQVIGYR